METSQGGLSPRVSRNRFCRYEFKYRLPRGMAGPVRSFVAAHLPYDPYSRATPDHRYDISSLYLDSPDLRLCRESHDGKKNRFKLRIRSYDDHPDHPVFLEIKRRLNTVILKDRCAAPRSEVAGFARPIVGEASSEAAKQFHFYRACLAAGPLALVRYRREAFEGDGPFPVRVTLDHDLRCAPTRKWEVRVGGPGWRSVLPNEVVLEIKFNGRFPSWLQVLVRQYQLQARSVSKYCLCLDGSTPSAAGMLARRQEA